MNGENIRVLLFEDTSRASIEKSIYEVTDNKENVRNECLTEKGMGSSSACCTNK